MPFQEQIEKKNRFKTLILENCLLFGQHPKFTNKGTDKAKYKPGQKVMFRVVHLDSVLKPVNKPLDIQITVRI